MFTLWNSDVSAKWKEFNTVVRFDIQKALSIEIRTFIKIEFDVEKEYYIRREVKIGKEIDIEKWFFIGNKCSNEN